MIDPAKHAFSLLDEFKKFAFKGNVIDMAVGVIIGTAFGKIIASLVDNIFMPLLTAFLPSGSGGYEKWVLDIGSGVPIGKFLADVVNFLIVAFALFIFIVKFLGWLLRAKKEETPAAAAPPLTADQLLLTEIRDLLAKRQNP